VGLASAASGRPGEALKWVVANRQSSTDYEDKRRQVGNAVAVWFLFLPLQLLIAGLLGWFAPAWLDAPGTARFTVRVAAALLAVNLVLQSLIDLPRAVLQGENLGYKRVGLSTSLVFIGAVLTVTALFLDTGLIGVAAAMAATTVLSAAVYLSIARRHVTWFGIARPRRREIARFAGLSGWFLLWNFAMRVMRAADVVVLGIAGSTGLVTSYSLARFVPEAVTTGIAIGIFGIMPGLGGVIGAGDVERARTVRSEVIAGTWVMGTVAGSLVLLWESSFLRLWVGDGYYPGRLAMLLIVVMVLQFALIRNDSNIIDLTLNIRRKTLLGVASAGASVALSWFLIRQGLGIAGLAVGFIGGRALLTVAYPWMVGRQLGISPSQQLRALIRPGLVTAALFGPCALLGAAEGTGSWFWLFTRVAGSFLVVAPLAFLGGLSASQRRQLWNRARRIARLR